jgi:hypothetical protein
VRLDGLCTQHMQRKMHTLCLDIPWAVAEPLRSPRASMAGAESVDLVLSSTVASKRLYVVRCKQ